MRNRVDQAMHQTCKAHRLAMLCRDGQAPVEETSDASPFAGLIQRARDVIASGSQEDQAGISASAPPSLQHGCAVGVNRECAKPAHGLCSTFTAQQRHAQCAQLSQTSAAMLLQDQILAEVDTELTVSAAKAEAADAQLAAVQGQTEAAQVRCLYGIGSMSRQDGVVDVSAWLCD